MGLAHSPRIVTDDLVLSLDASSSKNYNVGVSTNWVDKIGGNNGTLVNGTYHTDGPFVGAGYVEFDGTGDYVDIASSTDFAFGTGDFTIEVWVYLKANSVGVIYSNEVANSLFLYLDSGNLVVRNYGTTNLFDLAGPSLNTWTHIALSRSGTDLRLFFNGVQQGSTVTNSTNWTQNGTEIGAYNNGTQSLNGYMSNLRVVKGTALYTAAFTPPTKSLTAVPNTVLLTCQGNTISDASSSGHTLTANGDAAANLGYPASAFEFDGSNYDYILSAANPTLNWGYPGDFTVEMWVNVSSSSTYGTLFSTEVNAQEEAENTFVITISSSLQISVTTYSIVIISASSATAISANTWTHIVVTRQGTTLTLYIDKSSAGSGFSSINYVAGGYTTGALPRSLSNTNFTGKVSNVRVYKGKALTVTEIEENYNANKGRYA